MPEEILYCHCQVCGEQLRKYEHRHEDKDDCIKHLVSLIEELDCRLRKLEKE